MASPEQQEIALAIGGLPICCEINADVATVVTGPHFSRSGSNRRADCFTALAGLTWTLKYPVLNK